MQEFDELVAVMRRLRGPDGCPWDREQDHQSLAQHVLEESHELVEALEAGAPDKVREELGDLLLQIVFHAQLGAEAGTFDMRGVVRGIADKLYYRHPHVFSDWQVSGSDEVLHNWEQLKLAEEGHQHRDSALDGVPRDLPALQRAQKLQRRAAKVGFDWEDAAGPRAKLTEELAELDEALAAGDEQAVVHEVGDLLASVVNLCRFCAVDAEQALRGANRRFDRRFRHIEAAARTAGRDLTAMTLAEMDELWEEAKAADADAT